MLWLLIFACYTIYETIATATPICSTGETVNTQGLCIFIETTEMSWTDAESFCVAHGGHLVSIHNQFDNNLVRTLATSAGLQYNVWTGSSSSHEGIYSWSDGTPFDFTRWSSPNADPSASIDSWVCMLLNTNIGLYTAGDWMTVGWHAKYGFACERPPTMSDCAEWYYKANKTTSGIYRIVLNEKPYNVYCDMENGGGWTVFQNRVDGNESYWDRSWNDYKNGFNTESMNNNSNFWLGLDLLQQLTAKDIDVTLRIEMVGDRTQGSTKADVYYSNEYTKFKIANESNSYQLIDLYLDNKGDGINMWNDMLYSIGANFSTVEHMNDPQINCEWKYKLGGWWLRNCALSSLNGDYDFIEANGYGLFWADVDGFIHPRMTRMMLRPTYISK